MVYIDRGYPGLKCRFAPRLGKCGNIFKVSIVLIDVKLVPTKCRDKINICQTIVVKVANSDTAAIVIVLLKESVHISAFGQRIGEVNPRFRGWNDTEQRGGTAFFRWRAALKQGRYKAK